MGRKKPETVTEETKPKRDVRSVRLDLTPADHDRLAECAERRGLSLASYARMAVLDLVRRDEKDASP